MSQKEGGGGVAPLRDAPPPFSVNHTPIYILLLYILMNYSDTVKKCMVTLVEALEVTRGGSVMCDQLKYGHNGLS